MIKLNDCGFPVGIWALDLTFSNIVCIVNELPASRVLCMLAKKQRGQVFSSVSLKKTSL